MIKMISEFGSNSNQSFDRAKKLCDESKKLGFYGCKLQIFKAELLTKDLKKQEEYKKQETSIELAKQIIDYCKQIDLKIGVTPFYLEAIDELKDYVDFFKISSFDILRKDLIKKCIETNKDVFISLGLATDENIVELIKFISDNGTDLNNYYLLHCISNYPTRIKDCKIGRIRNIFLQNALQRSKKYIFTGYSDHTKDIDVVTEALSNGIQTLELHFDLDDKLGFETQYGHVWTPTDIDKLYEKIEKINIIMQKDFKLNEEQLNQRADSVTGLRQ
ncbi:MAG TPA: N-acetylneuraminate synthase family protein [Candidatus Lokiarchaeia archaeon]